MLHSLVCKHALDDGSEGTLTYYYWKQVLKLYREITYNQYNRIDTSYRNMSKHAIYTNIVTGLMPFMEHTFSEGLGGEHTNGVKNEAFIHTLQVVSNLIGSRFIDTKIMENMRDDNLLPLLNGVVVLISTIPVENLHVSRCPG